MVGDALRYVVRLNMVEGFDAEEFSRHLSLVARLPAGQPVVCKYVISEKGLYAFTSTFRLSHEQFWWRCEDRRLLDAGYIREERDEGGPRFVLFGWPEILRESKSPGECARLRRDLLAMGWDRWFEMEI